MNVKRKKEILLGIGLTLCLLLSSCSALLLDTTAQNSNVSASQVVSLQDIPAFSGEPYVILNNNQPDFETETLTTESYEVYEPLDKLGRCTVAYANIGLDLMPTEDRGSISEVKPTGWQSVKYDFVDGKYLYNRCHLIGFQLTGENANKENLITGTRYLNVEGMLPFENMVADYIKETENHVMYRVTPIYEGENLVANGVQMEAYSVEDQGEGICFNIYCYNNQPGVTIDYATGESWQESTSQPSEENDSEEPTSEVQSYVLNTNSKKFHLPSCSGADSISEANRSDVTTTREELIEQGYSACGICKP